MQYYETNLLGALTEDELRAVYDSDPGIEEDIREWLRDSDANFVYEQMDELKDVIHFEVDSWCNVWGRPNVEAWHCGDLAKTVRNSIFSYPSTIEDALCNLERYSEGAERLWYDMPEHFEKAINEQMQAVCDEYSSCFKADYDWWMDASSDELFQNYFLDDVDIWLEGHEDLADEFGPQEPAVQRVFVEDGVMFGGLFEARWTGGECHNPFWQVRRLPDKPEGKAVVLAQRGTRQEAFDLLWQLVMGINASWVRRTA